MSKKEAPKKLPDGDGEYMVVNIIARRARVLNKAKSSSLYDDDTPDPLDIAANEYSNGLLNYEFRHHLVGTGDDFRTHDT